MSIYMIYTPRRRLNFVRFALRWAVFELWSNYEKKYTEWHQNGLAMFEIKGTYMDPTYTNEAQIFIWIALQRAFCF